MIIWVVLTVLFVAATSGAFLARLGWPFEVFVSLLPQMGVVALLLGGSFVMLGRPLSAALALSIGLLCAYGARELFAPPTPALAERDARVVWANLLENRDAFRRVVRLAQAEDADAIVLAEYPHGLSLAEAGVLAGPYTYHAGRPGADGVKIAIFSRLPIAEIEPIGIAWRPNRQGLAVTLQTPRGPMRLIGVHPSVPAIPLAQRARDETTAAALQRLRAGGPAVLVGDFNTVAWSPLIRNATADGAVTRAHLGAASTWASPLPVLGLAIDHAFAAGGARVSARVGPGIASDHLPLIIDIALPR